MRAEFASTSGVGAGNVTKVKQLLQTAIPAVRDALRLGEISFKKSFGVDPLRNSRGGHCQTN